MSDNRWLAGEKFLRQVSPVFNHLADRYGHCAITPLPPEDYYSALIKGIISQQVASDVSQDIFLSFTGTFGTAPAPNAIIRACEESFLACGVAGPKIQYIKDLSRHIADGKIDLAQLNRLDDTAVIKQLTMVKGLGRWTAELFLILALARPDILPADDFGFKKAMKDNFKLPVIPQTRGQVAALTAAWRPWRSLAAWYLWQDFAARQ